MSSNKVSPCDIQPKQRLCCRKVAFVDACTSSPPLCFSYVFPISYTAFLQLYVVELLQINSIKAGRYLIATLSLTLTQGYLPHLAAVFAFLTCQYMQTCLILVLGEMIMPKSCLMASQPTETNGKSVLLPDLTKISSSKFSWHKKLYKWLYPLSFLSAPVICTEKRCHWVKPSPRLLETPTEPLFPMVYAELLMSWKSAVSIQLIDPLGFSLKVFHVV